MNAKPAIVAAVSVVAAVVAFQVGASHAGRCYRIHAVTANVELTGKGTCR